MKKTLLSLVIFLILLPAFATAGISMDGTDDNVDAGDITELNSVAVFSLSGWLKQDNNTDADRVFHKYTDGNNDISVAPFGGVLYFEIGNGSNSFVRWDNYSATISSGEWFHIATVFDGGLTGNLNRAKIYINGSSIANASSGTIPATTANLATEDLSIGSGTTTAYFGGDISEVAVWSAALTASEVLTLSSSRVKRLPLQIQPASIVFYWPMDDGADGVSADGDTCADLSENGNTGAADDGGNNTGLTWMAEEVLTYQ